MIIRKQEASENGTEKSQEGRLGTEKSVFWGHTQEFLAFKRISSPLTSGFFEIFSFSVGVHTLIGFMLLSEGQFSQYIKALYAYFEKTEVPYRIVQVCCYLPIILMLLCLCGAKIKYKNRLWYSPLKRIVGSFGLMEKILFSLTIYVLYLRLWENIILILSVMIISIIDTLLISNFILKKQENYQSSNQMSIVLKVGTFIAVIVNVIIKAHGTLQAFCTWSAVVGTLALLWFIAGGYQLYLHKVPRVILLFGCAIMVTNGVILLLLIKPRAPETTFSFLQWGVTLAIVMFFMVQFQKKKRFTFQPPGEMIEEGKKIKNCENNLLILLEQSDYDVDKQNLLVGILHYGQKDIRERMKLTRNEKIYDPQLKKDFYLKNYVKEKDSNLRFYIRYLYHRALEGGRNKQLLLDFAEFGISAMGDFSSHCIALGEAETAGLGFLERIRAHKLRLILREQSEAFNRLIHGGRLEFDEILVAQETYATVLRNIGRYCRGSIGAWMEALQSEVDLSVLRGKLSDNFALLPQINEGWNSISKFFGAQRHWKMVYLHFALFLKNERIKAKDLFEETHDSKRICLDPQLTPLVHSLQISRIDDSIYFEQRSTLIMCYFDCGKLTITKVSKNFEAVTGYRADEAKGSPLGLILPEELKHRHDGLVQKWIDDGHSTDQSSYRFEHVSFVNKLQQQIPATVGFKLYIDLRDPDSLLKFISLIKSDKQQEEESFLKSTQPMLKKNGSLNMIGLLQRQRYLGLKLEATSNIFLKEEHLQPAEHINEIQRVKQVMRLLTISLISLMLVFIFALKDPVKEMIEYSSGQISFLGLHNYPFILGKYYYSSALMPGSSAMVNSLINKTTEMFNFYKDSALTNYFIFNDQINLPKEYMPYIPTGVNENIQMSQVDLFFLIVSSITTLAKTPPTSSSHDFLQFNSYIMPGYDQMMNSTKQQLTLQLATTLEKVKIKQILKSLLFTVILLVMTGYIVLKLYRYFSKMRQVMDIIVQFNNADIQKIIEYWNQVGLHFEKIQIINYEEKCKQVIKQESVEDIDPQNKASLNQKLKNVVVSTKQQMKSLKMCLIVALLMGGFISTVLTVHYINLNEINKIIAFEQIGSNYFSAHPTESLIGYALMNRYYSSITGEPYNASRFEGLLSGVKSISQIPYSSDPNSESVFIKKMQTYTSGNPCTAHPELLVSASISQQICLSVAGRSFSNGIISFFRYILPTVSDYLREKNTMDFAHLLDISVGLTLVGLYAQDLIQVWYSEFSSQVDALYQDNKLYSLVACFLALTLHIFLFQMIVLPYLKRDHKFMKNVFSTCVPESIITKEKIIKHRFYQSGILHVN